MHRSVASQILHGALANQAEEVYAGSAWIEDAFNGLDAVVQIFVGTADMIVSMLQDASDGDAVRKAFAAYWRYQLAGLQALLHV